MLAFSCLLAEKFSCVAMFSKKEFAIVSNLRFTEQISCSAESICTSLQSDQGLCCPNIPYLP